MGFSRHKTLVHIAQILGLVYYNFIIFRPSFSQISFLKSIKLFSLYPFRTSYTFILSLCELNQISGHVSFKIKFNFLYCLSLDIVLVIYRSFRKADFVSIILLPLGSSWQFTRPKLSSRCQHCRMLNILIVWLIKKTRK